MKRKKTNLKFLFVLLAVSLIGLEQPASAQNTTLSPGNPLSEDGKQDHLPLTAPLCIVMDIYFIWYGCCR